MKKALVITYYFPPDGGNLALRITKFVKYLPEFGFRPYVITSNHQLKLVDRDLQKDVAELQHVWRIETSPLHMPNWVKKLFKDKYAPDSTYWWTRKALEKITQLHKEEAFDVMLTEAPHYAVLPLAEQVKQALGIPWICDIREFWQQAHGSGLFSNVQAEKQALQKADYLITNSQVNATRLGELTSEDKVALIYDGFDPDNYAHVHDPVYKKTKLAFAYCGSLNEAHSPVSFFKVLDKLVGAGVINPDQVEINIYGKNVSGMWRLAYYNLKERIRYFNYQAHNTSLQKMNEATVLLVFDSESSQSGKIPSKVFEYMYLEKPILAVVKGKGELTDILSEYGNAYICNASSQDDIKAQILKLFDNWKSDSLSVPIDPEFLDLYDCQYHTQQLSEMMESVLNGGLSDK